MALDARLRATLARPAGDPAVAFEGGWWSWGEMRAIADAVASGIGEAAPGAPVALLPRNRPVHLAALFAILAAGHSPVLINPLQGAGRIAEQLRAVRPQAVLADHQDWHALPRETGAAIAMQARSVSPLAQGMRPDHPAAPQTLSLLTSGTTGPSKRITLPASALEAAAEDCALLEREGADDPDPTFLSVYPITNIGGLYYAMPTGVLGRPLVLLEKFEVTSWAAAVARHRPGLLWLPPAAIRMVLEAGVPPEMLASARALRFGAAPLDEATRTRFEATYGIPVLAQYGATEFAGTVAAMTLADHRRFGIRGSVGRARPGIGLRVVDPATGEAVIGSPGRLEVLAPRMTNDWVATSDLARLDANGFLFLEGRADEAINRGGFKVMPEEVAAVLRGHPAVADAAVVAMPDARLGQVPMAAVELKPGQEALDAEALLAFARSRLIAYQVPLRIVTVPALPRTVSMKVDRPAVVALLGAG